MLNVQSRRADLKDIDAFQKPQLSQYHQQVLARNIDWNSYTSSNLLSSTDVGTIRDYDSKNPDREQRISDQKDFLKEQGAEVARICITILNKIQDEKTIEYVVALIYEMLNDHPEAAYHFHELDSKANDFFLRVLTRNSDNVYLTTRCAQVVAMLLSSNQHLESNSQDVNHLILWIVTKLDGKDSSEIGRVLEVTKLALKHNAVIHQAFIKNGGFKSLINLLESSDVVGNAQNIYVICFCLYILSYDENVHQTMVENNVIIHLVNVLKTGPREKIVRVVFGCLKNLMTTHDFKDKMLTAGLLKLMPAMIGRRTQDPDLAADMKSVDAELQQHINLLSSYERYQTEVLSGSLEWTPVHNEKFWRENIAKFEDDNFELIAMLVKLLESDNNLTVEVACYDLGEFARFHAQGKQILSEKGGKTKLMVCMNHKDKNVKKQALLAVQKLMVHNWESLSMMGR